MNLHWPLIYFQAVGPDGVPLCLNCFQPYKNALVQKSSVLKEENAWNTRFCSLKCSQEYWVITRILGNDGKVSMIGMQKITFISFLISAPSYIIMESEDFNRPVRRGEGGANTTP